MSRPLSVHGDIAVETTSVSSGKRNLNRKTIQYNHWCVFVCVYAITNRT